MKVGFIGLGNMGGPMALNMIKAGHTLTVYDVRREMAEPHLAAGAKWADSPASVAAQSEVVVLSLIHIYINGEVKRTFAEAGAHYAEVAQRAENQDGELSVLATGIIRLPTRIEK